LGGNRPAAKPRYPTGAIFFHASRHIQVRVIAECDEHRVLVMDEENDALIQADTSMLMVPIQDELHN
jgi:hypothetical protein